MNRIFLLVVLSLLSFASQANNYRLRKFVPATEDKNMPAVILCPGGSYHYLGLTVEGETIAKWLNKQGVAAFVLTYRVAPYRYPAMIEDLQTAIKYCRFNAAKFGIDPQRIGVIGFSAGGHLAGISAVYSNVDFVSGKGAFANVSARPDFVAMIYPVVTMGDDQIVHKKSRRGLLGLHPKADLVDSMSLERHVHRDMPPIFLVHSVGDNVVDYHNSLNLAQEMAKEGCRHKFVLYDTGTHGFGIDRAKGEGALNWNVEFIKWLNNLQGNEQVSAQY